MGGIFHTGWPELKAIHDPMRTRLSLPAIREMSDTFLGVFVGDFVKGTAVTQAEVLDITRTIASVISAAGISVAVIALLLQRRVWLTQHERARREKAIEILRHFNEALNARSSSTFKLIERLQLAQLKELDHGRPFDAPESDLNELQSALGLSDLRAEGGKVHVTGAQSYQLRFQALDVLNAAEIVCQAWDRDVADGKMLEEEIRFLFDPDAAEPRTFMKNFRNLSQGESNFPKLYKFIRHLEGRARIVEPKGASTTGH